MSPRLVQELHEGQPWRKPKSEIGVSLRSTSNARRLTGNGAIGRKARLQRPSQKGPESARLAELQGKREIAFNAEAKVSQFRRKKPPPQLRCATRGWPGSHVLDHVARRV